MVLAALNLGLSVVAITEFIDDVFVRLVGGLTVVEGNEFVLLVLLSDPCQSIHQTFSFVSSLHHTLLLSVFFNKIQVISLTVFLTDAFKSFFKANVVVDIEQ